MSFSVAIVATARDLSGMPGDMLTMTTPRSRQDGVPTGNRSARHATCMPALILHSRALGKSSWDVDSAPSGASRSSNDLTSLPASAQVFPDVTPGKNNSDISPDTTNSSSPYLLFFLPFAVHLQYCLYNLGRCSHRANLSFIGDPFELVQKLT